MVICTACGQENDAGMMFCMTCGKSLSADDDGSQDEKDPSSTSDHYGRGDDSDGTLREPHSESDDHLRTSDGSQGKEQDVKESEGQSTHSDDDRPTIEATGVSQDGEPAGSATDSNDPEDDDRPTIEATGVSQDGEPVDGVTDSNDPADDDRPTIQADGVSQDGEPADGATDSNDPADDDRSTIEAGGVSQDGEPADGMADSNDPADDSDGPTSATEAVESTESKGDIGGASASYQTDEVVENADAMIPRADTQLSIKNEYDSDSADSTPSDIFAGLPEPEPGPPSPLVLDDRGETEFGERWWLLDNADQVGNETSSDMDSPSGEFAEKHQTETSQEESDLTDPNALRPAHVPSRAAVELDRRRFEQVPTVFESEERRKNRMIFGAVTIAIIVALIIAFVD